MEKPKTRKELVKALVSTNLTDEEHDELMEMLIDNPISINLEKNDNLTFSEKVADKITALAGSWVFIICFASFILFWIVLNTFIIIKNPVDPYPFILLNLLLSCISALQAPFIMMSQNRQSKKDSMRNENDYLTDLKSELILEELHNQMDEIIKNQKKLFKYIDEKESLK